VASRTACVPPRRAHAQVTSKGQFVLTCGPGVYFGDNSILRQAPSTTTVCP
jgi:hypothetical protein